MTAEGKEDKVMIEINIFALYQALQILYKCAHAKVFLSFFHLAKKVRSYIKP